MRPFWLFLGCYGTLWDVTGCYGLLWVGYGVEKLNPFSTNYCAIAQHQLASHWTVLMWRWWWFDFVLSVGFLRSACDPLTALQIAPPSTRPLSTICYSTYPLSTILNVVQYRLVSPTAPPHLLKLSTLPKLLLLNPPSLHALPPYSAIHPPPHQLPPPAPSPPSLTFPTPSPLPSWPWLYIYPNFPNIRHSFLWD